MDMLMGQDKFYVKRLCKHHTVMWKDYANTTQFNLKVSTTGYEHKPSQQKKFMSHKFICWYINRVSSQLSRRIVLGDVKTPLKLNHLKPFMSSRLYMSSELRVSSGL